MSRLVQEKELRCPSCKALLPWCTAYATREKRTSACWWCGKNSPAAGYEICVPHPLTEIVIQCHLQRFSVGLCNVAASCFWRFTVHPNEWNDIVEKGISWNPQTGMCCMYFVCGHIYNIHSLYTIDITLNWSMIHALQNVRCLQLQINQTCAPFRCRQFIVSISIARLDFPVGFFCPILKPGVDWHAYDIDTGIVNPLFPTIIHVRFQQVK